MTTKRLIALAVLGLTTLWTVPQAARAEAAPEDNLANYLAMLRSDLSAAKVEAVNEALKLSESEAEKFWPIYREYDLQLAKLSDVKTALIRDFVTAQADGALDDAKAGDIAGRFLDYQANRLALWRKFHSRIEDALNAVRAAQFLQVEHQMALFIDLAIASEMPAVAPKATPASGESKPAEAAPPAP
jgi:hypothetical protein